MTLLTIDDEIAWMRQQVDFLRRQHKTLVETGRLTQLEADRRLHLVTTILGRLEQQRPNMTHTIEKQAAAGQMRSNVATVRMSCNGTFEDISLMNCDVLLQHVPTRIAWVQALDAKLIAVIRQGLGRQG